MSSPVQIKMLFKFVLFPLLLGFVLSDKICTNSGSPSHTSRYELFSSKNSSWEKQNPDHFHLIPTVDHTWSNLIPRKMLRDEDETSWDILNGKLKGSSDVNEIGVGFLNEVSLHDVRLDPSSVHGLAQQTNLEYLLMFDVDRLVWSFRKTAGLETPGQPYGGWEAPNIELRGHFVGHYLSASAQMWASTHNTDLNRKMSALISSLSECQITIGTGYLSAFPSELFDRFEALKDVWAPYYTIHKILAGLLDQYTLAGSGRALNMAMWMVDYFYKRVQNVILKYTVERHWLSLNEETGGMNDVLYRLYIITGDRKHLLLAHLFDKPCFLGLLALKADGISGFHANTHIPIVIGAQLRYEITGEPLYKEIGTFFMDIVNSSHSYATGGNSVSEFWSDPKRLASTLQTENQESCTTYNMLKVSRNLFRWTKEMAYADYYERALTNGVLGIQRGREPGVMIYMLPLRAGGSKASRYSLYDYKSTSTMKLRIPLWTNSNNLKATFNGQELSLPAPGAGNFLSITRSWRPGDEISLDIPLSLRSEAIKDDRTEYASIQAFLYGPYLLSALSSGDWDIKIEPNTPLSDHFIPIPSDYNHHLITLSQESDNSTFVLSNSDNLIKMRKSPEPGTDAALKVTFRLIVRNPESKTSHVAHDNINKLVTFELFDFPGSFLSYDGKNESLGVFSSGGKNSSMFRLIGGLDGKNGTVSFEAESRKGCFIYSGPVIDSGSVVKLNCSSGSSDDGFRSATSFGLENGISKYDPLSFVAKGVKRNFVLVPLLSLRDESYTVYFNTSV